MLPRLFNKFFVISTIFLINYSNVQALTGETNNTSNQITTTNQEINFVVTGYYTPLPDQEAYFTGDFKSEVRLNGDGLHMASGKEVFTGAIAAPKEFAFGTKIYLNGFGVGVVEDRGGAINRIDKNGESYDAIDIWMGSGDEGRIRCKNWGRRELKGYVVGDNEKITLDFKSNIENLYQDLYITPDSTEEDIKKLQLFFSEIGLYDGKINGIYSDIKPTLLKFQLKNGIITSEDDDGAGYFGPKTITKINELYGTILKNENLLNKKEINSLKTGVNNLKIKLGINYDKTAKRLLIQIAQLKQKQTLAPKVKSMLDYLEYIL
nr:3D domain-containing protein [Candidatus Gracilibacteria bacterium]